jgi:hypothetical protein
MFAPFKIKVSARAVALAVALATSSFSAQAVLERAGPVNPAPSVGSYPAWYQDTTGVTLEFCDPLNAAELSGGWCLLLPPDVPVLPEVFPTSFFDEHFYFAGHADAGALLADPVHGRASRLFRRAPANGGLGLRSDPVTWPIGPDPAAGPAPIHPTARC